MTTVILGGGTISKVKEHLALSAPAYGKTARYLHKKIRGSFLFLTKMARDTSDSSINPFFLLKNNPLDTVEDVDRLIDSLIADRDIKCIIMTCAICDFKGGIINEYGRHNARLSSQFNYKMQLTAYDKIISKIRKKRTDIFLVAFKTTVGANEYYQFRESLKMLKTSKCNLVLANDLETKNNLIVVPEENYYESSRDRYKVLDKLVEMIELRKKGTYNPTLFMQTENVPYDFLPENFRTVLEWCIKNNAYQLNDNGFTTGHFCVRGEGNVFISSQRKVNHNDVAKNGMTKCEVIDYAGTKHIVAQGTHKPSVGARSQAMLLKAFPDFDCLIHFHGRLRTDAKISTRSQFPYQCGSFECGQNTLDGMTDYDGIKAVHLDKHGPNILFKSTDDPLVIIDFIEKNWRPGKIR